MRAALDGMQGSARSMREHIHTIFDDDAVQEEPEGMTPRGIEPLQPRTTSKATGGTMAYRVGGGGDKRLGGSDNWWAWCVNEG